MVKKRIKKKVVKRKGRKKSTTIVAKKVNLNNKSRKGLYWYVRVPGKTPSYYKVKEGVSRRDILAYYRKKRRVKGVRVTKQRVSFEKKLVKLTKKYPKIDDVLENGYAENTVRNPNRLTPYGMRTAYMNLLRNKDKAGDGLGVVRDKELLTLITERGIVEKWKHRVMFEVMINNHKGELLAQINNTTTKLLGEIKKEVIDKILIGQEYESQYRTLIEGIEGKGYRVSTGTTKSGKVGDVLVKMVFRKAR